MDFLTSTPRNNLLISLLMMFIALIFLFFIYSTLVSTTKTLRQNIEVNMPR